LPRSGYAPDLDDLSATVPGLRQRVDWLTGPPLDLSSSALRERARRGLPLRYLVPPSVEAYVREHGLYSVRSDE
jgi:nicotinic acid mononucleotide adenylyltransferase